MTILAIKKCYNYDVDYIYAFKSVLRSALHVQNFHQSREIISARVNQAIMKRLLLTCPLLYLKLYSYLTPQTSGIAIHMTKRKKVEPDQISESDTNTTTKKKRGRPRKDVATSKSF